MPIKRTPATLLCVTRTVMKSIGLEDDRLIIARLPRRGQRCRCPRCGQRRPVHDCSSDPRRRRALDLGATMTFIEYPTLRVRCPVHGVVAASVPWAHHASRFTHASEGQAAWLRIHRNRSVAAQLMRIDRKGVGPVCERVYDRLDAQAGNRFDGLVRMGIDGTSYKKGRKYMTVALDHGTCRVIWCARGHGEDVLQGFFDLPSEEQRASIEVVAADGARRIAAVVADDCENAERVPDPFHAVPWMTAALDEVRRMAWRDARSFDATVPKRKRGRPKKGTEPKPSMANAVRNSKFAVLKNPEDSTDKQVLTLEGAAREDRRPYRVYLLKERFRDVFKTKDGKEAAALLDPWLAGACHGGVEMIGELSRKVRGHRDAIVRAVELGISNARAEAINNKTKLTVGMGYGFRNVDNLTALVMLRCSNLPVTLPGGGLNTHTLYLKIPR